MDEDEDEEGGGGGRGEEDDEDEDELEDEEITSVSCRLLLWEAGQVWESDGWSLDPLGQRGREGRRGVELERPSLPLPPNSRPITSSSRFDLMNTRAKLTY